MIRVLLSGIGKLGRSAFPFFVTRLHSFSQEDTDFDPASLNLALQWGKSICLDKNQLSPNLTFKNNSPQLFPGNNCWNSLPATYAFVEKVIDEMKKYYQSLEPR